jgi:uroporphyrinogen-III synthase
MRILVTRPARVAEETASRLGGLGHEPVVSPVLDVAATGAVLPPGPFDMVLATSAQAIEALTEAQIRQISGVPLYVVGARTAAAVELRGLAHAVSVAVDGAKLAQTLREAGMSSRNVLYLAGRDRKTGLEEACAKLDIALAVAVLYEARPAAALTPAAISALRDGQIDAVLHFSRRSAEIFLQLARAAHLGGALRRPRHICLSADVAAPLLAEGLTVVLSPAPNALSLFGALESL